MIKICAICGKEFVAKSGRQEYCSKACLNSRQTGELLAKDMRTRNESKRLAKISFDRIDEVLREAERRGMSYGQYVAVLEGLIPERRTA